jgi:hypothetical protein
MGWCTGSRWRRVRLLALLLIGLYLFWSPSSLGLASLSLAAGGSGALAAARLMHASKAAPSAPGGGGGGPAAPPPPPSLVWVLLGDTHFQPYLLESIQQARLMNPGTPLYLVCEEVWLGEGHAWVPALDRAGVTRVPYSALVDDFTVAFDVAYERLWEGRSGMMQPTLNHRTNMGFTSHTMVRLVALHRLLEVHGIQRAVHLENDQMVYGSVAALADAADGCGLQLGMTRVGERFAPAVVYSRTAASLKVMLDFIFWAITAPREVADSIGKGYPTDMSITATFFDAMAAQGGANATAFGALPPSNDGTCVAAAGQQLYDGLGLGCWCCGDFYHPKQHLSVRLAESRVRYWEAEFAWVQVQGLRVPVWNGSRVFNLHMHNKQLHLFRSSDPGIDPVAWAAAPERN